ncbi:WhiB family transcriptional regulator [Kitasatospora kazusensis]|uniref:Transcriptional regulator WhiB n=1 Tax=Kitasatospora kazusensis TaxID=407974 RepID=A0ABN3A6G5_9ACTN
MTNISRLPGAVADRWDWQSRGSCGRADTALFFHPAGERDTEHQEREEAAKAVCAPCPVRIECRRHALQTREPFGVWGGLTEDERHRLVRARSRRPAPARGSLTA